jgi:hypothetical protein
MIMQPHPHPSRRIAWPSAVVLIPNVWEFKIPIADRSIARATSQHDRQKFLHVIVSPVALRTLQLDHNTDSPFLSAFRLVAVSPSHAV